MVGPNGNDVRDFPPHGTECDPSSQSALNRTVEVYPRLAEIGAVGPDGGGRCSFEIAPGIFMQSMMTTGVPRSESIRHAAKSAIDALRLPQSVFGDMEALTLNLRSMVAAARSRGLPVHTHRIDLAAPDQWIAHEEPLYLAGFETLSANLQAKQEWLVVSSHIQLEQQFGACMADLRDRLTIRRGLHGVGADGLIDGLALKSLLRDPDVGSVFHRLSRFDHVSLTGGVVLIWEDGRILSSFVSRTNDLEWCGDTLSIHGRHFPDTVGTWLIGRPVSLVVDVPEMDDTMVIAELANRTVQGRPSTSIRLRLPQFLVNLRERRHWRA